MSEEQKHVRREDDLTRLRSEVNEHRIRLHATETLGKQLAENQKELSLSLKDLAKSLSKLEKKFTVFITALIVSVGFGDGLAAIFMKLI